MNNLGYIKRRRIEIMEIEKSYYDVYDVIKLLGVSKSKAYAVMREMNDYLEEQGYLVISGKVPARYFNEKWYGGTHA